MSVCVCRFYMVPECAWSVWCLEVTVTTLQGYDYTLRSRWQIPREWQYSTPIQKSVPTRLRCIALSTRQSVSKCMRLDKGATCVPVCACLRMKLRETLCETLLVRGHLRRCERGHSCASGNKCWRVWVLLPDISCWKYVLAFRSENRPSVAADYEQSLHKKGEVWLESRGRK